MNIKYLILIALFFSCNNERSKKVINFTPIPISDSVIKSEWIWCCPSDGTGFEMSDPTPTALDTCKKRGHIWERIQIEDKTGWHIYGNGGVYYKTDYPTPTIPIKYFIDSRYYTKIYMSSYTTDKTCLRCGSRQVIPKRLIKTIHVH